MKKIIAIVLCAFMIMMCFVSCGKEEEEKSEYLKAETIMTDNGIFTDLVYYKVTGKQMEETLQKEFEMSPIGHLVDYNKLYYVIWTPTAAIFKDYEQATISLEYKIKDDVVEIKVPKISILEVNMNGYALKFDCFAEEYRVSTYPLTSIIEIVNKS